MPAATVTAAPASQAEITPARQVEMALGSQTEITPASQAEMAPVAPRVPETAIPVSEPASPLAPAPIAAKPEVPEAAPAPAPVLLQPEAVTHEPAPPPLQPAPRPAPEPIDVKEDLSKAGLVMIETDRAKVAPVVSEPEPAQLGRPRRERAAGQAPTEDELVQIETRK